MASILDAGLASIFTGIFVFLLVFALVYGALSRLKPFGDKNMGTYAIIAFTIAMLMSVAPPARNFIVFVAPWYVALAIVLFFILFLVGLFGVNAEKQFPEIIKDSRVHTWIIILSIVIMIAGLAFTFGQTSLDATQGATTPPPTTDGQNVIGNGAPYQPPGTISVNPNTGNGVPQAGQPGSTATSDYKTNLMNTIIHPKVMGLFVTLLIAAVAIYFLSNAP